MSTNFLRSIIQPFGFDFHRYHKKAGFKEYVKTLGIETVLDIGANIGQFAKEIREVLPEAHIYSFEPLESCFKTLENEFKGDQKFTAFNFALGEKEESIEMNKSEYAPSSSILEMAQNHKDLFPHTKEHKKEKIHIKILDEVAKNLDLKGNVLIKVDVQGFEDKVLNGGLETFKKAKVVLIENSYVELYEGQPLFHDIYAKLKSLGFTYKGGVQQKLNKKTGEIISEDSLFIK